MRIGSIIINLTIFNPDFEYDGEFLGWWLLQYVFNNLGALFMLGGITLLMVEHSLARKIKPANLGLMPDKLWVEMTKKNYILRKLFH